MRHFFKIIALAAVLALPAKGLFAQDAKQDILVAFEMKGSLLSFDVGVLDQLYPKLDPEKIGTTFFTGSSSGSVLTAYFACHGLSAQSVEAATREITTFNPALLGEDDNAKIIKMFAGINVEKDIRVLDSFLLKITNNGTCVPTAHPFAIIASNDEVVRDTIPGTLRPANSKRLNFDTLDVFDIATGNRLGKACTYFTNEAGAAYLQKVPEERRLCDIRLVKTAADLMFAVRASVSEPTYFPAIAEPNPSAFLDIPPPASRRYQGGLVMQAVVQDFKLADPELLTIGIGGNFAPRIVNRFLKNIFLIDVNRRLLELNWWYDVKIEGSREGFDAFKRSTVNPRDLMEFGRKTVKACVDADSCNGRVLLKPEAASKSLDGTDMTPFTHRGLKSIARD